MKASFRIRQLPTGPDKKEHWETTFYLDGEVDIHVYGSNCTGRKVYYSQHAAIRAGRAYVKRMRDTGVKEV